MLSSLGLSAGWRGLPFKGVGLAVFGIFKEIYSIIATQGSISCHRLSRVPFEIELLRFRRALSVHSAQELVRSKAGCGEAAGV